MSTSTGQAAPHRERTPQPGGGRGKLALSILLNGAVPLLVYALLRPRVGSDATALAIGAAIPVVATLAVFGWRRRIDPIGVVAVVAFGIALLVLALSGGNPLVLKLQDAVVTGPLGLVCLASVAVGRPLHLVVMRLLARRNPRWAQVVANPELPRTSSVVTALLGATFVLHALVLLGLALVEPTTTFLALSRPVGLAVIAAGVATLWWYRRRRQAIPGAQDRGAA